jgi:hypothetical protein
MPRPRLRSAIRSAAADKRKGEDHAASISNGSLFLTLPTRVLTGPTRHSIQWAGTSIAFNRAGAVLLWRAG